MKWMGRLAVGCFLLFGICACSSALPPQARFAPVYAHGQETLGKNDLSEMAPSRLLALGNDYLAKGHPHLALLHFGVAVEKDPDSVAALMGLGRAFYAEGKLAPARKAFAAVLEKDPENLSALFLSGKIARRQGAPEAALRWFKKALKKKRKDPEIMTEMARTYDDLGRLAKAAALFEKVAKSKPGLAASHNNLGYNLLLQGRYPEAIGAFSRAYVLNPKDLTIQCNLGAAYALNGDDDRALAIFKSAIGAAQAYNDLGYFSMIRGDYESAERDFNRALQLRPRLYLKADENLSRLKNIRSRIDPSHSEAE